MKHMTSAGQFLRTARVERGVDQRTLAARAGTSQAQISRIERGQTSPSVETLSRLLAALGERLELQARPLAPNQPPGELRADFERLSSADRLAASDDST
jgi:transcriptional regulator with XRE-family HTH domain